MTAPRTSLMALLLAAALAGGPGGWSPARASASDDSGGNSDGNSAQSSKDKKAEAKDEARVFTNADLKRYRSRAKENTHPDGTIVVNTTKPEAEGPPEGAMDPGVKRAKMEELRAALDAAQKRLSEIPALKLSVANPYVPKPKLSEEDQLAFAGKNGIERMRMLEAEEASLRSEIARLQDELAALSRTPELPPSDGAAGDEGATGTSAPGEGSAKAGRDESASPPPAPSAP